MSGALFPQPLKPVPLRNRQQWLIGWAHVLVESIQQNCSGSVIAHQGNNIDEPLIAKQAQRAGGGGGTGMMFADRLAAQSDNDRIFLRKPFRRFAVSDDIDRLWRQPQLQSLWF